MRWAAPCALVGCISAADGPPLERGTAPACTPARWFPDRDEDGFGDGSRPVQACEAPLGFVDVAGDCDDGCEDCNPGSAEVCDEVDHDCDGPVDDGEAVGSLPWCLDQDGDGFGADDDASWRCEQPPNRIEQGGDCADDDAEVHPGATDMCLDGIDSDCDGFGRDCLLPALQADGRLEASSEWAGLGTAVAGPGDVDGDGFADLVVGAPWADEGGESAGAVYLALGPLEGAWDTAMADGRWTGSLDRHQAGGALSPAGDADGDGLPDLWAGASHADGGAPSGGAAYLLTDLAAGGTPLRLSHAVVVGTQATALAASALHGGEDIDGDGVLDLLMGVPRDATVDEAAGAAWVLLGPLSGMHTVEDGASVLRGVAAGDRAGTSVSVAGDVDGDGRVELLVGAPWAEGAEAGAGVAYLAPFVPGDRGLAEAGVRVVGDELGAETGAVVLGLGDLDADGFADIAVSSPLADDGDAPDAGRVHVFLGPLSGTVGLSQADSTIVSRRPQALAGASLARAGDLDGSGLQDLLVGARYDPSLADGGGVGSAVLDLGAGTMLLGEVGPSLTGESAWSGASAAVAGLGDTDGDGFDDVVIGAPGAGDGGAAYILRGREQWQ